ncbi:SMP-30/gluconolactonase/LRE family protein [Cupriavidus yeoncheonensis]|uniref:SMP-30/gluconolactonase/LRE family protein n=1 Tax=Cupriavidus yeoncheonensis TaxID=1462994 RepID=UPI001BA9EE58|nr:SMP-30/gluconolactonase/LRE family protein [Cupriavidus yeoncheonensis]
MIVPPVAGFMPNDLVFDARGGFYFIDFKGNATEPKGGVYYAAPDLTTIKPVLPNLAMANGLALSPDGKTLWATEFGRNLLHRIELADATTIAPIGSAIAYHFVGPAPDSMRADAPMPTVTCTWRSTGKAACWPSIATASPSASCFCPDAIATTTWPPPAWPSIPAGTISTWSPATPTRGKARPYSMPRRSARGCRRLHSNDSL